MSSGWVNALRPKPFRGDVVAAGVVVLTTLVVSVAVRFSGTWPSGTHLAYAAVAWAFVTTMAVLAPMEREHPRAYQSILYVASVALFVVALVEFARTIGLPRHDDFDGFYAPGAASSSGTLSSGAVTWIAALVSWLAFGFAWRRNSAICTLIAALAGGVAVLVGVDWLFSPDRIEVWRRALLALAALFSVVAIGELDHRPRHSVVLLEAAGLAVLLVAITLAPDLTVSLGGKRILSDPHSVGWGWELLILVAGFGLVAFSAVERQPGPAYLGVLNLVAFTLLTTVDDGGPTLLGWPLDLAVAAAALLAIGLRPTTPAPPPPDVDAPEAPPLPLR